MDVRPMPPVPVWKTVAGYQDIIYAKADEGIAKIVINRPESATRSAPRPCRRCRLHSRMRATTRTSAS